MLVLEEIQNGLKGGATLGLKSVSGCTFLQGAKVRGAFLTVRLLRIRVSYRLCSYSRGFVPFC